MLDSRLPLKRCAGAAAVCALLGLAAGGLTSSPDLMAIAVILGAILGAVAGLLWPV